MSKKNEAWGIEVGANAIKAIQLVRTGDEVQVADHVVLPFKKILTTPDLDVDEQIQLGLDNLLSTHDLAKSTVVVSVAGHMGFARFAKLPPVDPKKIPDIVKFEAAQQIPFPIDQVEWDYHVFSQPDSPDVEAGIFAITQEKINDFLEDYRQVGIAVDGVTLSPLAVYNAMAYDLKLTSESNGVVMLDIGSRSTDVIIFNEGNLWMRTLNIGGNTFTECLVEAFKLSFPKAEKLKRESSTSKYARQIFTAMRPVFADLVQEVQRSLAYYQSLNRDAQLDRLIGFGSTFRLPGLQKYFKQQIQMDVTRPDGFDRISVDGKQAADFSDHAVNLATAYGLALQGLDLAAVDANILPAQITRQQLWRSKQPWFAASAAMVALPALLLWGKVITTSSQYESEKKRTDTETRPILNKAQKLKKEWDNITRTQDPRPEIESINRLLDYRDVWPKVLRDINEAIASFNPQKATLTSNYKEYIKIPRGQRRRIYIKEIDAGYEWKEPESMLDVYIDGSLPNYEELHKEDPVTLKVTVRGTSPMKDAPTLLTSHFIKWLEDNADLPDRPYRIVVPIDPPTIWVDEQEKFRNIEDQKKRQAEAKASVDNAGLANMGRYEQQTAHLADKIDYTLEGLLPQRPTAKESMLDDIQFEIKWKMKIVNPNLARDAERGKRPKAEVEVEQDNTQ